MRISGTEVLHDEAKEKYRGMFEIQKSGDKTMFFEACGTSICNPVLVVWK